MGVPRLAYGMYLLAALGARPALGQSDIGLELERRGRYEEAATAYRAVVALDETNVAAWLGLERVSTRLGRLQSITPLLDSVISHHPASEFMRELELRVWSALGDLDAVGEAAEQWITYAPGSPTPYRHWAAAAIRAGASGSAIQILKEGRARLGGAALAADLAQAYVGTGAWYNAAEEWSNAVVADESHITVAAASLRQVPESYRNSILTILVDPGRPLVAHRLGAEVLVSWNRPEEGWTLLESALPADQAQAAVVLGRFAARALRIRTREAARARGCALERLAQLTEGTVAERARVGAAQAFADAGDLVAAQRMLEDVAATEGATSDAASARATLIQVTLESGRLEEADARFRVWQEGLRADDAERLRHLLGAAWIRQGELNRAEQLVAADSSIAALAVRGWIELYRGRLRAARDYFTAAGPQASTRGEATRRTSMLALLQNIKQDTLPRLGQALLLLEQGDTSEAVDGLVQAAMNLDDPSERAHLLALAGRQAAASGHHVWAESLLEQALEADSLGPAAPAAEYALAMVYAATGRPESAARQLEHLILSHAGSAVVPEARRMLDEVRGAIPKVEPDRRTGTGAAVFHVRNHP